MKIKEEHKNSRVKLIKVNFSKGKLVSKEDIDQIKLKEEEKEKKAVQKQLKAKQKKAS